MEGVGEEIERGRASVGSNNDSVSSSFGGLDELNVRVRHWLETYANARAHGTTGKVPQELLVQESLTPVTACPAYRLAQPVRRGVSRSHGGADIRAHT